MQRRVEYWLAVLTNEGDNTQRAKFLLIVINGLAIERALPVEDSTLTSETETAHTAVDCILNAQT